MWVHGLLIWSSKRPCRASYAVVFSCTVPTMAKQIIEKITDDIDGTPDATAVTFGYEGKTYEIDLSDKNKEKLAKALEPYISAGRSASQARRATGPRPAAGKRQDTTAIREWAKANGHNVSERGRIAADVIAAYEAAH